MEDVDLKIYIQFISMAHIGIIGLGSIGSRFANRVDCHRVKNTFDTSFVDTLVSPKKVIVASPHGTHVIQSIAPYLTRKDTIIDCSNSWYSPDIPCMYLDAGINGECLSISGETMDYLKNKDFLNVLSPHYFVGPVGSGTYVSMVHDAIECALLQLTSEGYSIGRDIHSMSNEYISDFMDSKFPRGVITEKTIGILRGNCDVLHHKLSCSNVIKDAVDFRIPIPTISMSDQVRSMSLDFNLRNIRSKKFLKSHTSHGLLDKSVLYNYSKCIHWVMMLTIIQGCEILLEKSRREKWDLDIRYIISLWGTKSL